MAMPQQRPFLYLITDESLFLRRQGLTELLEKLLPSAAGNIAALHLRAKSLAATELRAQAVRIKPLLAEYRIPLVVHAELAVAQECAAEGVQLSEQQLSEDYVAAITQAGMYWALSSHCELTLEQGFALGARYAFFSPVFSPLSKPEDRRPTLGVDRLQAAAQRFPGKVVALGGIEAMRIHGWSSMSLAGVASMGAISTAVDPLQAFATIKAAWCAAQ